MKTSLFRSLLPFLAAVLFFSCSKSSSSNNTTTNNNPTTVDISGMAFNPSTINVKVGSTITWTNKDNMAHTVTADDNSFNSGSMNQGDTFKYTFNAAGTFKYHCVYHSTMLASVVVTQ